MAVRKLTATYKDPDGTPLSGVTVYIDLIEKSTGLKIQNPVSDPDGVLVSTNVQKQTGENGIIEFDLVPNKHILGVDTRYQITVFGITRQFIMPNRDVNLREVLISNEEFKTPTNVFTTFHDDTAFIGKSITRIYRDVLNDSTPGNSLNLRDDPGQTAEGTFILCISNTGEAEDGTPTNDTEYFKNLPIGATVSILDQNRVEYRTYRITGSRTEERHNSIAYSCWTVLEGEGDAQFDDGDLCVLNFNYVDLSDVSIEPKPDPPPLSDDDPEPPGDEPNGGSCDEASRCDHIHPKQTVPQPSDDVPSRVDDEGSPGTDEEYSRGDHTHEKATIEPDDLPPDTVREPSDTPPTNVARNTNVGIETKYARGDHEHALSADITGGGTGTTTPLSDDNPEDVGTAPDPGDSDEASRSDHIHKLADDSVNTPNVVNKSITNEKLADNSVNTSNVVNRSITNEKLADNSVNTTNVVNRSITSEKLAHNSVNTTNVVDNSITNVKLSADARVTVNPPGVDGSTITRIRINNVNYNLGGTGGGGGTSYKGIYNATLTYSTGDIVSYQSNLWISRVDNNTNNTPQESVQAGITLHWLIIGKTNFFVEWMMGHSYNEGTIVEYTNRYFLVIQDITNSRTAPTEDITHFREIFIGITREEIEDELLPVGGTTGQSLVKRSDADFDVDWETITGGGGQGDGVRKDLIATSGASAQNDDYILMYSKNPEPLLYVMERGAVDVAADTTIDYRQATITLPTEITSAVRGVKVVLLNRSTNNVVIFTTVSESSEDIVVFTTTIDFATIVNGGRHTPTWTNHSVHIPALTALQQGNPSGSDFQATTGSFTIQQEVAGVSINDTTAYFFLYYRSSTRTYLYSVSYNPSTNAFGTMRVDFTGYSGSGRNTNGVGIVATVNETGTITVFVSITSSNVILPFVFNPGVAVGTIPYGYNGGRISTASITGATPILSNIGFFNLVMIAAFEDGDFLYFDGYRRNSTQVMGRLVVHKSSLRPVVFNAYNIPSTYDSSGSEFPIGFTANSIDDFTETTFHNQSNYASWTLNTGLTEDFVATTNSITYEGVLNNPNTIVLAIEAENGGTVVGRSFINVGSHQDDLVRFHTEPDIQNNILAQLYEYSIVEDFPFLSPAYRHTLSVITHQVPSGTTFKVYTLTFEGGGDSGGGGGGTADTAEQIRDKLEGLVGSHKLSIEAIKGTNAVIDVSPGFIDKGNLGDILYITVSTTTNQFVGATKMRATLLSQEVEVAYDPINTEHIIQFAFTNATKTAIDGLAEHASTVLDVSFLNASDTVFGSQDMVLGVIDTKDEVVPVAQTYQEALALPTQLMRVYTSDTLLETIAARADLDGDYKFVLGALNDLPTNATDATNIQIRIQDRNNVSTLVHQEDWTRVQGRRVIDFNISNTEEAGAAGRIQRGTDGRFFYHFIAVFRNGNNELFRLDSILYVQDEQIPATPVIQNTIYNLVKRILLGGSNISIANNDIDSTTTINGQGGGGSSIAKATNANIDAVPITTTDLNNINQTARNLMDM